MQNTTQNPFSNVLLNPSNKIEIEVFVWLFSIVEDILGHIRVGSFLLHLF